MSTLSYRFKAGAHAALAKFALGPPTQVDQFIADIEHGKDVLPEAAMPPMSHVPGDVPPALDGTMPLQMPSTSPATPPGLGSTVGDAPLPGDPGAPPPSMDALGG